jgi:hypothetical protein
MSKQSEHKEFIAAMAIEGMSVRESRKVLRLAATLTKLAEAQCNGDWPADNGERETLECLECGCYWHPSAFTKSKSTSSINAADLKGLLCVNCRTEARLAAIVKPLGIEPIFNGDPRGCVVKLRVPSGKTNDWGREGICVP